MHAPGVRTVLLCDDQRELRDAISLLLGNFPRFRVVAEAADGPSCLRQIAEAAPDIVIMDVSLPGGGAALVRSARAGRPDMHIVMFSGHDEPSVQADMLAAGADSYVIKTGRLKPLMAAIDSSRRPTPGGPAGPEVRPIRGQPCSFTGPHHDPDDHPDETGHQAFFYANDRELLPELRATAMAALAGGGRFVVVATPEHRAALRAALPTGVIDVAIGEGRFVELDAERTLASFMRRGFPDPILFDRSVGATIRAQAAGPGTLHAFGEMVSLLWHQGNLVGTLRLEQLWTQLQRTVAFELVCGYRMTGALEQPGDGFTAIGDLHTKVSAGRELELRPAG